MGIRRSTPARGWVKLFDGTDLAHWQSRLSNGKPAAKDAWAIEDGTLTRKGRAYLWSVEKYGDFILDLELKVGADANSGILLRHNPEYAGGSPRYWWNGLLEIQILDSYGKATPDKHDCGALYDMLAPSKNTMKKAGEWNRLTITAQGSRIEVVMNGSQVLDADLADWTQAGKNPDGTPNKYHQPMCKLTGPGHIILQEHPGEIWFRNIAVKPLK